jgi:hypothetical protein
MRSGRTQETVAFHCSYYLMAVKPGSPGVPQVKIREGKPGRDSSLHGGRPAGAGREELAAIPTQNDRWLLFRRRWKARGRAPSDRERTARRWQHHRHRIRRNLLHSALRNGVKKVMDSWRDVVKQGCCGEGHGATLICVGCKYSPHPICAACKYSTRPQFSEAPGRVFSTRENGL